MKKYITCFFLFILFTNGIPNLQGQEQDFSRHSETQEVPQNRPAVASPLHELPNDLDSFFKKTEKESDTFVSKFANMLAILGLLIAFMLLASWFIKRMMRTRVDQLNTESVIRVVETRYLSPKSSIHLLDVMGQGILIAESNAGVHQLAKIHLKPEEDENTRV